MPKSVCSKIESSDKPKLILKQYDCFDGIRGIAILMVIISHIGFSPSSSFSLFHLGVLGVDIFLVLSGFLITSALLKSYARDPKISIRKFYYRRIARVYPALILLIVLSWIVHWINPDLISYDNVLSATLGSFTLSLNWMMVSSCKYYQPLSSLWSLSLEEQFYVVLPLVFLFIKRYKNLYLLIIVGLVPIGFSIVERYSNCFLLDYFSCQNMLMAFGTRSRLMGQAIGMILACFWYMNKIDVESKIYHGLVYMAVLLFSLNSTVNDSLYPTSCLNLDLVYIFSLGLICQSLSCKKTLVTSILDINFLKFTGRISYGLYLWNTTCFWVIGKYLSENTAYQAICSIICSYLIACLSYYYIEKPILKRVVGILSEK